MKFISPVLLFALFLLAVAGSCKKEDLPEEYPNRFDITFNGEPWFDPDFEDLRITHAASRYENYIRQPVAIYATNANGSINYYHIYFTINPFSEGTHQIPTSVGDRIISRWNDLACGDYFIDQEKPYYIRVDTLDWENEDVQGFMEFFSYNNCGDSIHFEMEFDFQFETWE